MASSTDPSPSHASESSKVPLLATPRQPLSSLLYPKIAKVPSLYEISLQSSTAPHPGKRLPSPPKSPSITHPEWPPSPTSPRSIPLLVISPAAELTSSISPTSPFPTDLPHQPQPVQTGNFISRLFMRAPAHLYDVELGTIPQRRIQETRVMSMGEEQRRRNERVFRIKIAGVVLAIIGFWGLVGVEVWRRQGDEVHDGIGGAEGQS